MSETAWLQLIGILDTAVKIGLGAVIGLIGALCLEAYRSGHQRVRDAEQRYRDNLEKPVVEFVDETLILMSHAYWNKLDKKRDDPNPLLEALRDKEVSVQAKMLAMGRPDVEKYFSQLDASYLKFRGELPRAPAGDARDLMKEAQRHAANLFAAVYPLPPKKS
jgi:hypothetical protein